MLAAADPTTNHSESEASRMPPDVVPAITRISVATIKYVLDVPIHYGDWVMRHREFVLVGIELESGGWGFSYGLSREGPIAQIVDRSIAPMYVGQSVADPEQLYLRALWSNHAVHAAGIGMRALSLVDIATWDALARLRRVPIGQLLSANEPIDLPATAIVGYPPSISAGQTGDIITKLLAEGWRRFKLPIAPDPQLNIDRLEVAREVAPDAWIGFDANMVFRTAPEVLDFERQIAHLKLGWIEDLVPPGDAGIIAAVHEGSSTPIAMGDEQGGSYHPEALLTRRAVDYLRVDATTNGGITGLRRVLDQAKAARVSVAPHMFPHFHARLMSAFATVAPIEWGVAGTGVHPMDDTLERPTIVGGLMRPLAAEPGFGRIVAREWIADQEIADPGSILDAADESAFL